MHASAYVLQVMKSFIRALRDLPGEITRRQMEFEEMTPGEGELIVDIITNSRYMMRGGDYGRAWAGQASVEAIA